MQPQPRGGSNPGGHFFPSDLSVHTGGSSGLPTPPPAPGQYISQSSHGASVVVVVVVVVVGQSSQ